MVSRLVLLLLLPLLSAAQEAMPYQPETHARESYEAALHTAQRDGKRLWIQIGEPGCPACQRLYWFIEAHAETAEWLHRHFIPLHVGISRENIPLFRAWDSPQLKHGVPVILVLDADGVVLTISPAGAFTASVGEFSEVKIMAFLRQWTAKPAESPEGKP